MIKLLRSYIIVDYSIEILINKIINLFEVQLHGCGLYAAGYSIIFIFFNQIILLSSLTYFSLSAKPQRVDRFKNYIPISNQIIGNI